MMTMQMIIERVTGYLSIYGLNVIGAIAIFLIGKRASKLISNLLERVLTKSKVDRTLTVFAKNIAYFSIMTFVVIASLNKLGIETNSFLAVIGAAGLAVGLAFQGALSSFAAGVMMIIFKPFGLGDRIETSGIEGTVDEIQTFNTIIKTNDNKRVIIPNSKITSDKIIVHLK